VWCHNPEGLRYERQLAFYPHLCVACEKCYEVCSSGALPEKPKKSSDRMNGIHKARPIPLSSQEKTGRCPIQDYEKEKCVLCGTCADVCPAAAIELIGRDLSPEEVIKEVGRDRQFYENSGGGMTVSGGEPLAQADFTAELLSRARATGIHTVLDTSGFAPFDDFEKCLPFTDHVYYDLKIVDDPKHERLTGSSNRLILDNLKKLGASGKPLTIRIPLIKGLNDSPEDISDFARVVASLSPSADIRRIEIIPYHRIGEGKYKSIGLEYELKSQEIHSKPELQSIIELFEAKGLTVYCSQLLPPSLGR
jgi:pyruvate formate lyase activating enzyme